MTRQLTAPFPVQLIKLLERECINLAETSKDFASVESSIDHPLIVRLYFRKPRAARARFAKYCQDFRAAAICLRARRIPNLSIPHCVREQDARATPKHNHRTLRKKFQFLPRKWTRKAALGNRHTGQTSRYPVPAKLPCFVIII